MGYLNSMRALLFILFTLLLIFSSPALGRSLKEIKQSGEIRICLVPIHPSVATATPDGCVKNCQFKGPVYDESLAFARFVGKDITPKFRRINWNDQFLNDRGEFHKEGMYTPALLANGTCDLFPTNLMKNRWRTKKMDFVMLFPSRMMVVVHKSKIKEFRNYNDLGGKLAVAEHNTSFHGWLKDQNILTYASNKIIVETLNTNLAIAKVNQKEADFTILDADAAIWTTRYEYKNLTVAFPVGPMDKIGWMVSKKDVNLKKAISDFFNQQRRRPDSQLNLIWKKYFGQTLTDFIRLVSMIK
jgi:hypothetical protein